MERRCVATFDLAERDANYLRGLAKPECSKEVAAIASGLFGESEPGIVMFACVYVPDFVAQAILRLEPDYRTLHLEGVVVVDGALSQQRVVATTEAARRRGVTVGMTKLQAESCGSLLIRKRDVSREQSAQNALLDVGQAISPRVESTAPGIITVDVHGLESLFGTPTQIASRLQRQIAQCQMEARIAIASNPDAALTAAKGYDGISIIPYGEEASRLAPLLVDIVCEDRELLDVLGSWGVRTCRDLALLPPVPLTQRLGQKGLVLQRLARGETKRTLVPIEPVLRFEESIELEDPIELLEPLAFILHRLLVSIGQRLRARSLAMESVDVHLGLEWHEDGDVKQGRRTERVVSEYSRHIKLPLPVQETSGVLKLMQLDLAAHPPSAPIHKIRVTAEAARPRHAQAGLFQPLSPDPEKLEITMARLRALVGESDSKGRALVGSPTLVDTHTPDAFQVMSSIQSANHPAPNQGLNIALHVFRPPIAARVSKGGNTPCALSFGGIHGKVLHSAGPWRRSGSWWESKAQWMREEWDVALQYEGGVGVFRIYLDLSSNHWFVEALYD